MKICATSDLHGNLPPIPECDLLLIGGDICPYNQTSLQSHWLEVILKPWLEQVPAKEIVAVAGNHDFIFQDKPHLVPKGLRWHYLQDEGVELFGMKIWGTPWQPIFYHWAFNLNEAGLKEKFDKIPEGIDILVCHGPPYGLGDYASVRYNDDETDENGFNKDLQVGEHTGSKSLLNRVLEVKPLLVVYGHIHPGRGVYHPTDGIVCANVALVNEQYLPVNNPMVFDLEDRKITMV